MNQIYNNNNTKCKDEIITRFNTTLNKASPERITKSVMDSLKKIDSLTVFAFGKASGFMLLGLARSLKLKSINGLLASNVIPENFDIDIKVFKSSHPLSNQESLKAGHYAIKLAKELREKDTVICLISGGGSSLFESLINTVTLESQKKLSETLLKLGMEDHEVNLFRKLFSSIKGGKLAGLIAPAKIINLIISDDLYNSLEAISSGPTVKSTVTKNILKKKYKQYDLSKYIDSDINKKLYSLIQEFDTKNYILNRNINNHIILDNSTFLKMLKDEFNINGLNQEVEIYTSKLSKYKKDIITFSNYLKTKIQMIKTNRLIVLAGGEIPINIVSKGKGGRNQHLCAMMLNEFLDYDTWLFASIATDGHDCIKGISGAIVSNKDAIFCKKKNINIMEYIQRTNTYELHKLINTHIYCNNGTGLNVSDIYIFIYYKKGFIDEF